MKYTPQFPDFNPVDWPLMVIFSCARVRMHRCSPECVLETDMSEVQQTIHSATYDDLISKMQSSIKAVMKYKNDYDDGVHDDDKIEWYCIDDY